MTASPAHSCAAMPVDWGRIAATNSTAAATSNTSFIFFGMTYPTFFNSRMSPPKNTTGPSTHKFRLASDALRYPPPTNVSHAWHSVDAHVDSGHDISWTPSGSGMAA
mgnify:CR=1 FL=1